MIGICLPGSSYSRGRSQDLASHTYNGKSNTAGNIRHSNTENGVNNPSRNNSNNMNKWK